jgi:protein-S-isoprenylcysteine O-methyltransferase Ste14
MIKGEHMSKNSNISWIEPVFFIFFGVFHIHRIWGLFNRKSYADFWLSVMNNRGWLYFLLMGVLLLLCITGIYIFFKNKGNNHWWRWVYIFGGVYLIFDLFAILIKLVP